MSSDRKLLPCPFCGHDDQLYPCYEFPGTGPCTGIDCLRCGIDFVPREGMDVFAAWNKRAGAVPNVAARAKIARAVHGSNYGSEVMWRESLPAADAVLALFATGGRIDE